MFRRREMTRTANRDQRVATTSTGLRQRPQNRHGKSAYCSARLIKALSPDCRRSYDATSNGCDAMGRMDFIGDLDRSKIVALGFVPVYGGMVGELRLLNLPMFIQ
jgi:hypothetical protein